MHVAWAWVTIVANAVAGLWAFGAHKLPSLRGRHFWWFTAAAQIAIFVQVFLGVVLMNVADVRPPDFHIFYGFVAAFVVGITYSYRRQLQQVYLWYGAFGLFLMGLCLRAVFVGPGVGL